jgi:VWFA-related protein
MREFRVHFMITELISSVGRYRLPSTVYCLSSTAYRLLFAFVLLLIPLNTAAAQSPDPVDVLRIDTDLVTLSVSVFNRTASQSSIGLQQKDFAVLDDGAPQEIAFFESRESPFDLVLLLDLSGSTADKIGLIRKSAKRFVDAARPEDRIAIFTFTADLQVVSKLTADHAALKKSIDAIEKPTGGTNFWDALKFVLEHVVIQSRVEQRRSAIVVMTDGVDNALPDVFGDGSVTPFAELMQVVRRMDSIILPIYLDTEKESNPRSTPPSAYAMAREQLSTLAAESGNQIYRARKVKDLDGVYAQVIRDLSTVYSIGYRPATRKHEGAWHEVAVQVVGHPDLAARAKRGYFETISQRSTRDDK